MIILIILHNLQNECQTDQFQSKEMHSLFYNSNYI